MALVCRPDLQLTVANGRGLLRRARGDANAVVLYLYVLRYPRFLLLLLHVSPHNQAIRTKRVPSHSYETRPDRVPLPYAT